MDKETRQKGITDIYERFRLMLDESISDMKRKIDNFAKNLDELSERIEKLEEKV